MNASRCRARCNRVARTLIAVMMLTPTFADDLAAQAIPGFSTDASRIMMGDSVRLRLPGNQPISAEFRGWDRDLMLLGVQGIENDWPVSIFDVAHLDLRTERTKREGLRHYAILAGAAGVFIGAAVGVILHSGGVTNAEDEPSGQLIMDTLQGAGLGFVGGVIAGGLYGGRRPGRGWVEIALPTR